MKRPRTCRGYSWIFVGVAVALALGLPVTVRAQPTPAPSAALLRLQAQRAGEPWQVRMNAKTGTPRLLSGSRTRSYPGTPEEASTAFLDENLDLFLPAAAPAAKRSHALERVRTDRLGGGHAVCYRQTCRGVPVYGASVVVALDTEGRVVHVAGSTDPAADVAGQPARTLEQIHDLFVASAVNAARKLVKVEGERVVFAGPPACWAYRVVYNVGDPSEPWEYVLDAETANVLKSTRLVLE